MIVVDTDILIWILRGNESIKTRFKEIVKECNGFVFITPVQIAEIYAGMKEDEKIKTDSFLDSLKLIDIDRQLGKQSGKFVGKYRKSHSIKLADALIGAAAKVKGFKLWTLNKKHYPMFDNDEFVD